jgi:hypothetical protein
MVFGISVWHWVAELFCVVPNTKSVNSKSDNGSTTCTNETDVREFGSNFDLDHSEMDDSQITALQDFFV